MKMPEQGMIWRGLYLEKQEKKRKRERMKEERKEKRRKE